MSEAIGRDFDEQRQADVVLRDFDVGPVVPGDLHARELLAPAEARVAQREELHRASAGQPDALGVGQAMVDVDRYTPVVHRAVDLDDRVADAHRHGGVDREDQCLRLLARLHFEVVGVRRLHERELAGGLKFERGATEAEQMRIAERGGGRRSSARAVLPGISVLSVCSSCCPEARNSGCSRRRRAGRRRVRAAVRREAGSRAGLRLRHRAGRRIPRGSRRCRRAFR